jgi:putative membrane protein
MVEMPVADFEPRIEKTEKEDSRYARFDSYGLTLRDELAIDRTLLANERTLMAYLRSGVALLIAGVTIIHFSNEGWFWGVGMACLPTGLVAGIIGLARYRKMSRSISAVRKKKGTRAKPAVR